MRTVSKPVPHRPPPCLRLRGRAWCVWMTFRSPLWSSSYCLTTGPGSMLEGEREWNEVSFPVLFCRTSSLAHFLASVTTPERRPPGSVPLLPWVPFHPLSFLLQGWRWWASPEAADPEMLRYHLWFPRTLSRGAAPDSSSYVLAFCVWGYFCFLFCAAKKRKNKWRQLETGV